MEDWGKLVEHILPIPLRNNSTVEDKRQGAGLLGLPSSRRVWLVCSTTIPLEPNDDFPAHAAQRPQNRVF